MDDNAGLIARITMTYVGNWEVIVVGQERTS
jgi:hypothetical protein